MLFYCNAFSPLAFILKMNSAILLLIISDLTVLAFLIRAAFLWSLHPLHDAQTFMTRAHEPTHPNYAPASRATFVLCVLFSTVSCREEQMMGRQAMRRSFSLRIDALPPNGNNRKELKCTVKQTLLNKSLESEKLIVAWKKLNLWRWIRMI